jgi:hypothetical protein
MRQIKGLVATDIASGEVTAVEEVVFGEQENVRSTVSSNNVSISSNKRGSIFVMITKLQIQMQILQLMLHKGETDDNRSSNGYRHHADHQYLLQIILEELNN